VPESQSLGSPLTEELHATRTEPGTASESRAWTLGESILAFVLAARCLVFFCLWVPVYITWPYFTDHDHFGIVAQAWSLGRLPYRETFCLQFPGELYLFRILGSLVGWGNSVAFYAVDATMVGLFGVLLMLWSVRRFHRILPGLIGLSVFLGFYLSQDNHVAGQRDWHGAFFMMSSFFALGLLPSRIGRVVSGVALGVTLSIRPQFVLAVPGLLLAVDQSSRALGESWRKSLRPIVEWCVVAGLTLVIMFLPLIVNGLMGDLLRNLRTLSAGEGFSPAISVRLGRLTTAIRSLPSLLLVPLALLLVARESPACDWRGVFSALAIHCGMLLFKPLSPENHDYYMIPTFAGFSVVCAYLAGAVLATQPLTGIGRALIFLLIAMVAWSWPAQVTWTGAVKDRSGPSINGTWTDVFIKSYGPLEAVRYLRHGEMPIRPPSGRFEIIGVAPRNPKLRDNPQVGWDGVSERYPWQDYRAAMEYLRGSTTAETPVATFLLDCTTSVTAAIPRPSPFFVDGLGLKYYPGLMPKNIAGLEASKDSVVVWDPAWDEAFYPQFAPLYRIVREKYRLEAAFGHIEVWRRISEAESKIAR
jgi:hypothetical protein